MATAIYYDCPTGISGDMALGALVDLGVPLDELRARLASLPVPGWSIEAERITSYGITGTRLHVGAGEDRQHRHLSDIQALLDGSSLPGPVVARSRAIFERLAVAEAAVHGTSVEEVHFHEVGAVDSILDIVGWALGLHLLGVEEVYGSPLPLGSGWIDTAHGRLPVPAPATMALLSAASAPTRPDDGLRGELVTPTGAALLATCARFERPALTLRRIGYGFGRRDMGRANAVRAWLGERQEPTTTPALLAPDALVLLETNVDDQPGEQLAYVLERLLAAGALDAWATPVLMKKGRPAVVLAALVPAALEQAAATLIFRETTSLGLRRRPVERHVCERELVEVKTPYGSVRVKRKRWQGEELGAAPEYEDCARLALAHDVPLRAVYEAAVKGLEAVG